MDNYAIDKLEQALNVMKGLHIDNPDNETWVTKLRQVRKALQILYATTIGE